MMARYRYSFAHCSTLNGEFLQTPDLIRVSQ